MNENRYNIIYSPTNQTTESNVCRRVNNNHNCNDVDDGGIISPAPLWRNAPTIISPSVIAAAAAAHHHRQMSPKPAQNQQQQQNSKTKMTMMMPRYSPSSSLSALQPTDMKSFQQSLRSYPIASTSSSSSNVGGGKQSMMKSSKIPNKSNERCFVTSLEVDKKLDPISPFYLDYLEWNNQQQKECLINVNETQQQQPQQQQQQFDHSKFMDMFRMSRSNVNSNKDMDTHPISSSCGSYAGTDSLPYSVNDDSQSDVTIEDLAINVKPIKRKPNIVVQMRSNLRRKQSLDSNNNVKQVRISQPTTPSSSSSTTTATTTTTVQMAKCHPQSNLRNSSSCSG